MKAPLAILEAGDRRLAAVGLPNPPDAPDFRLTVDG
jgi:hypothetical protein